MILGFLSCDSNNNIKDDIVYGKTGAVIDSIMNLNYANGFSGYVFVVGKEEVIFSRAYGYSDQELKIPIDQNTVFDIGSLTKQFTAAAILKLEMEGKLSVETSISEYFPNIPVDKKEITIHHLLTHTSGFRWGAGDESENLNKEEMLERAFSSQLRCNPGEEFHWSHMGYNVLGAIIEEVSGKSYEEYVSNKLFRPSGMKSTGYVLPKWSENQIAHGYSRGKDWGKPTDYHWSDNGPFWNFHASGGMLSTAGDIIKWDRALRSAKVLSDEAKYKFFEPWVSRGKNRMDYGYGWAGFRSVRKTSGVLHSGGNGKFFNELMRYVDDEVSIYICSNNSARGIGKLTEEIANIIFTKNYVPNTNIIKVTYLLDIPDDMKGKRIKTIIEHRDIEDLDIIGRMIAENFSKRLIDKHGINRLSRFMNYYRSTGETEIRGVDYIGDRQVELYLYSDSSSNWYKLKMYFTQDADYLIDAIFMDRTNPIEE